MTYLVSESRFRLRELANLPSTQSKIAGFSDTAAGWHFGEGVPPTEAVIERAFRFETYLKSIGFAETDAFLGISGEIMVTGYQGDNYVEVLTEVDGQYGLVYEHGEIEELNEEHRSEPWVRNNLRELVDRLWNVSALSTSITTIGEDVDSQAWHSGILQAAVLRLLTEPVSTQVGTQYVSILSPSTPAPYPVIPPYIGNSTQLSYRTGTG